MAATASIAAADNSASPLPRATPTPSPTPSPSPGHEPVAEQSAEGRDPPKTSGGVTALSNSERPEAHGDARGALPWSPEEGAADLFGAEAAEDAGDWNVSIETQQGVYSKGMASLQGTSGSSPARIEAIRVTTEAGYYLAWGRMDQGNRAEGDKIIAALTALLREFDVAAIRKEMKLPVARLTWLRSHAAEEDGDTNLKTILRGRVLALTQRRRDYPEDYGPISRLRIAALWAEWGPQKVAARVEACNLANELEQVAPGEMLWRLMQCDLDSARNAMDAKQYPRALTFIANARKRAGETRDTRGRAMHELSISEELALVSVENLAAEIAQLQNDPKEQAYRQIEAKKVFVRALQGRSYFQNATDELRTLYFGFRDIDVSLLDEYETMESQNSFYVDFYQDIGNAIEASRTKFPGSPGYALVAGDALAKVAFYQTKLRNHDAAIAAGERSVAIFTEGDIIGRLTSFSENAELECSANSAHARRLADLKRADEALAAHRTLEARCGSWLRRYPWDFYARRHVTGSAWRVGVLLKEAQRYAEALPLLRYASNWGTREATTALAEMYREGLGVAQSENRANALTALASRQTIKRFTVDADFDGLKYPFSVYVLQYGPGKRCPIQVEPLPPELECAGFEGIDDQAMWVQVARGGVVASDVLASYRKMNAIGMADESLEGDGKNSPRRAPPPPAPLAKAMPPVLRSSFFAIEQGRADGPRTETTRISRGSKLRCFGWSMGVAPVRMRVPLREVMLLPRVPGEAPTVSGNSTVLEGGKRIVTEIVVSATNGELTHSWCADPTDPLGKYRIDVYFGDVLVKSFPFRLVE